MCIYVYIHSCAQLNTFVIEQRAETSIGNYLKMCLFKYVLSVEHDSIDPRHLLKNHQHETDHQRLVDTRIFQIGHVETGALRENRQRT